MSGQQLYILVEADSKEEAIKAADSELDSKWESGDLHEGEKGSVTGGGEVLNLAEAGGEAKLLEFNDRAVHSAGSILSGHTFKHLVAAAACFAILRYFQTRRPIA